MARLGAHRARRARPGGGGPARELPALASVASPRVHLRVLRRGGSRDRGAAGSSGGLVRRLEPRAAPPTRRAQGHALARARSRRAPAARGDRGGRSRRRGDSLGRAPSAADRTGPDADDAAAHRGRARRARARDRSRGANPGDAPRRPAPALRASRSARQGRPVGLSRARPDPVDGGSRPRAARSTDASHTVSRVGRAHRRAHDRVRERGRERAGVDVHRRRHGALGAREARARSPSPDPRLGGARRAALGLAAGAGPHALAQPHAAVVDDRARSLRARRHGARARGASRGAGVAPGGSRLRAFSDRMVARQRLAAGDPGARPRGLGCSGSTTRCGGSKRFPRPHAAGCHGLAMAMHRGP
jgi:hypothetical protein